MRSAGNRKTPADRPAAIIGQWFPVVCTCGKIAVEVSVDRHWLRYLCRDRDHGGKVYAYVDLRNEPNAAGTIEAVAEERLERQDG